MSTKITSIYKRSKTGTDERGFAPLFTNMSKTIPKRDFTESQKRHRLIFDSMRLGVAEELYGKCRLYEVLISEVTFRRLSEKGKSKALALGYSPAMDIFYEYQLRVLPYRDGELVSPCPRPDFYPDYPDSDI